MASTSPPAFSIGVVPRVAYGATTVAAVVAGCAIGLGVKLLLQQPPPGLTVPPSLAIREPEPEPRPVSVPAPASSVQARSAGPERLRESAGHLPLSEGSFLPERASRKFGAKRPGRRPRECGRGHCGVDVGSFGIVVRAARDGVVEKVQRRATRKEGRYVRILHPDGLVTYYMHLHRVREDLREGMHVAGGEPIGVVGKTGIRRSKPHLHFAVARREGKKKVFLDPEPLLREAQP